MEKDSLTPTSIWNLDDETIIEKLQEIDIAKFKDGRKSFLAIATKKHKVEVVKALLQKGACPGEGDDDVNPYFICTYVRPNLDILNLFLETETFPPVDGYGYNIAHVVALKNEADLLDAILGRFPSLINEKTNLKYNGVASGSTPLHIAVSKKYTTCINVLLEHRADLNAENDEGIPVNALPNASHNGLNLRLTSLVGIFGAVPVDTTLAKPCEDASRSFTDYLHKFKKSASSYDINKLDALSLLSKSAQKALVVDINNNLMQKIRASIKQYTSLYKPVTNHPFFKNQENNVGLVVERIYDENLFELAKSFIKTVTEYKNKMVDAEIYDTEIIAADVLKQCKSLYCNIKSEPSANFDYKPHRQWFFNEQISTNGKASNRINDLEFIIGVDEFVKDILDAYSISLISPLQDEFLTYTDLANDYIRDVSDMHRFG